MSAFEITVKVSSDRDLSCKTYTYSETTRVRLADFSNERTKGLIEAAHQNFKATHPHNHTLPNFLPTDVRVKEVA